MALIFIISSQPKLPPIPGLGCLEELSSSDKIKHVAAYAVLGWLVWRALGDRYSRGARSLLVLAISVAYGISDEIHQKFVPNRTCDICDLAADALGVCIALIAMWAKPRLQTIFYRKSI